MKLPERQKQNWHLYTDCFCHYHRDVLIYRFFTPHDFACSREINCVPFFSFFFLAFGFFLVSFHRVWNKNVMRFNYNSNHESDEMRQGDNKLFCRLFGHGRHVSRSLCHELQRFRYERLCIRKRYLTPKYTQKIFILFRYFYFLLQFLIL